jgi:hydrogenase nickel incorporation protein HypA/HybF
MHELSIVLNILDMAAQEAARHGTGRVVAIHLKLGPLSGVVGEALRSAFELAREGSPCGDAQLVIEEVPIVTDCPVCAAEREVVSLQELCCARCGAPATRIVRGRELEVVALELEA